jgi:chromate transporter
VAVGVAAAIWIGPYLVLALLTCGAIELVVVTRPRLTGAAGFALPFGAAVHGAGLGSLAWTAFKVGALSFGGGFVIIPLMRADAVHTYHWMTDPQFLNAVALGQVTPGPVVATVSAVGFAAHGLTGGLLAAAVAFLPSFSFVLLGGGRFERLRGNARARAFLDGAGPAAIGAILGAAVVLATTLSQAWQFGVAGFAAVVLFGLRRGVVVALVGAGAIGAAIALAGGPLP